MSTVQNPMHLKSHRESLSEDIVVIRIDRMDSLQDRAVEMLCGLSYHIVSSSELASVT